MTEAHSVSITLMLCFGIFITIKYYCKGKCIFHKQQTQSQ